MDIVVTVPKTEYENNIKEREYQKKDSSSYGFRIMKKLPKKLDVGDRIYFVRDGQVSYSKEVIFILPEEDETTCLVTGRNYSGNGFRVCFKNERDERHLDVQCKGFQGFRYKWWTED